MHALEPEIRRELLNLYETELPSAQNMRIVGLVRIADGWETDVYSFALEYEKAAQRKRQDLILRIYPGDDALEKSAREFHMDYHPWNILLRADGAAFVIDWGAVQVSDYRLDLAWTLLLMSTYGTPNVREIVLGEYERSAEGSVEGIEFFEAIACLRRLASIALSLSQGAAKMGMRAGAEVMMQDVSHVTKVYALLRDRTGISIPAIEELLATLS